MLAERVAPVISPRPIPGKVVLVAGGCDSENEILVRDLLRADATVIWPTQSASSKTCHLLSQAPSTLGISTWQPRLHTPAIDARNKAAVKELKAYCEMKFSGIDAVVANFGDHEAGPTLLEASDDECEVVNQSIVGHMLLSRAFAPILARRSGSSYIFVNDSRSYNPNLGGLRSTVSAAELALAHNLSFEMGGKVNVHTLLVTPSSGSSYSLDPYSLGEAVALIVKHPTYAKSQIVIQGRWREALDPEARGPDYCSCL